jgi:hypothetical protein
MPCYSYTNKILPRISIVATATLLPTLASCFSAEVRPQHDRALTHFFNHAHPFPSCHVCLSLQVESRHGIVEPFQEPPYTEIRIDIAKIGGLRRRGRFDRKEDMVVLISTNAILIIQVGGSENGLGVVYEATVCSKTFARDLLGRAVEPIPYPKFDAGWECWIP